VQVQTKHHQKIRSAREVLRLLLMALLAMSITSTVLIMSDVHVAEAQSPTQTDAGDDILVWRPSTGGWYSPTTNAVELGTEGDIPLIGDIDGDGTDDYVIYRPSTGGWFANDTNNNILIDNQRWGIQGDIPLLAQRSETAGTGGECVPTYSSFNNNAFVVKSCDESELGPLFGSLEFSTGQFGEVCAVLPAGVGVVDGSAMVDGVASRVIGAPSQPLPDAYVWIPSGHDLRASGSLSTTGPVIVGVGSITTAMAIQGSGPQDRSFTSNFRRSKTQDWRQALHPDGVFAAVHGRVAWSDTTMSYSAAVEVYNAVGNGPGAPMPCIVRTNAVRPYWGAKFGNLSDVPWFEDLVTDSFADYYEFLSDIADLRDWLLEVTGPDYLGPFSEVLPGRDCLQLTTGTYSDTDVLGCILTGASSYIKVRQVSGEIVHIIKYIDNALDAAEVTIYFIEK